MMTLHQRLEARFHLNRCRTCIEPEGFERLALDVAHDALFRFVVGIRPRCSTCAPVYFADNAKRIAGAAKVRRGRALAGSHFPGRTMAGDGILLIGQNVIVLHAGEEVVVLVVVADVSEAKVPILVLAAAAFGRAMGAALLAADPFAARPRAFDAAILGRLDANAIEQG